MKEQLIETITFVGASNPGRMTAAALCRVAGGQYVMPMIGRFNRLRAIGEDGFLREAQGTGRLDIEFVGRRRRERCPHGLGVDCQGLLNCSPRVALHRAEAARAALPCFVGPPGDHP